MYVCTMPLLRNFDLMHDSEPSLSLYFLALCPESVTAELTYDPVHARALITCVVCGRWRCCRLHAWHAACTAPPPHVTQCISYGAQRWRAAIVPCCKRRMGQKRAGAGTLPEVSSSAGARSSGDSLWQLWCGQWTVEPNATHQGQSSAQLGWTHPLGPTRLFTAGPPSAGITAGCRIKDRFVKEVQRAFNDDWMPLQQICSAWKLCTGEIVLEAVDGEYRDCFFLHEQYLLGTHTALHSQWDKDNYKLALW